MIGDRRAWRCRSASVAEPRILATGPAAMASRIGDEQIGVVVRKLALDDRGHALETHPGVDRRCRQRVQASRPACRSNSMNTLFQISTYRSQLHSMPRQTGSRAGQLVAAKVIDLRAPSARPRFPHRPEVVGRAQLADPLRRHQRLPCIVGLVVPRDPSFALEDGGQEAVRRQLPDVGEQLPGEGDRLPLEVVAEGQVAEHLEERVVTVRGADVIEIVVLAADAHALLRRSRPRVGPLFLPEEHVLELVHPGVGEQQRRIVVRHERRARDDGMAVFSEVLEKSRANLA